MSPTWETLIVPAGGAARREKGVSPRPAPGGGWAHHALAWESDRSALGATTARPEQAKLFLAAALKKPPPRAGHGGLTGMPAAALTGTPAAAAAPVLPGGGWHMARRRGTHPS